MSEALKDTPAEQFPAAPVNDATKPVLRGASGGIKLPINRVNGKIAVSTTPPGIVEERTFLPPHDILFYVVRTDPRGPAPTNPADDPQYENWEEALKNYAFRENEAGRAVSFSEPPTEIDAGGSPELSASVEILSPANNTTLTSKQLDIQVKAAAPRGVVKVTYQIDGKMVGKNEQFPFNFSYNADWLHRGTHTLVATAEDDQGNAGSASVVFNLDVPLDPPTTNWSDSSPLTLKPTDFPRLMNLDVFRYEDTKDVKIFLRAGEKKKFIYSFKPATEKAVDGKISFTWKTFPGSGEYTLVAQTTDNAGMTRENILFVVAE